MPISEYDAFGPWIYEIDEEHPVPRLFAPYVPSEAPLMLFKLPRGIERRVATPDMDLYDYVAGAYPDRVLILSRREDRVEQTELAYSELEGLRVRRHLLAGLLTFCTKNGQTELPFNAVSMDIIRRFTALIRRKTLVGTPLVPDTIQAQQRPLTLDPLFGNLLRDLKAEGETPLLCAYQPEAVCAAPGHGFLDRFRHTKLPATLHVVTPEELLVLQQEAAPGKQEKGKFIYYWHYLPLSGVRDIQTEQGENWQTCTVSLAHHTFPFRTELSDRDITALYTLLRSYLR